MNFYALSTGISVQVIMSIVFLLGFWFSFAQQTLTLPYSESFENGLGKFFHDNNDDFNWTRYSGKTPSRGEDLETGPRLAADGSYYMYTEASNRHYDLNSRLNLEFVLENSVSSLFFQFSYHMYGSSMGTLRLQAKESNNSWTTLWSMSGDQGDLWHTTKVNLSAYLGGTISIRFAATTGSSFKSDMAIDNIYMETDDTPPIITPLGNVNYFSQFDELIESGSSVDRPEDHTGSTNRTSTGVTGFSQPSGVDCSGAVNYPEALALVNAAGARLPTLEELQDDATRGTGCGYDANLIWTQSQGTNPGERWVDTGNSSHANSGARSINESATAYVRYIYDNEPIANLGASDVYLSLGDPYTDAGATASDNADGDLTSSIVTVNPVNTNSLGTYTITYNVSDIAGNMAEEVTRTVHVKSDARHPAITNTLYGDLVLNSNNNAEWSTRFSEDMALPTVAEFLATKALRVNESRNIVTEDSGELVSIRYGETNGQEDRRVLIFEVEVEADHDRYRVRMQYNDTGHDNSGLTDLAGNAFAGQNAHNGFINTIGLRVEALSKQGVLVYPNPVRSQLHLAYPTAIQATYRVYGLTGKTHSTHHGSGQNHQLNVSGLSKGVYLLKAEHGNQQGVFRFVKE